MLPSNEHFFYQTSLSRRKWRLLRNPQKRVVTGTKQNIEDLHHEGNLGVQSAFLKDVHFWRNAMTCGRYYEHSLSILSAINFTKWLRRCCASIMSITKCYWRLRFCVRLRQDLAGVATINQSINYFICRHKCITMGTCNTEIHRLCYKQPYSKYRNSMIIKITHSHTIDVSSASGF